MFSQASKHRASSNLESLYIALRTSLRWNLVLLESVDETLLCDHSNETSLVALSLGTICLSAFCKI